MIFIDAQTGVTEQMEENTANNKSPHNGQRVSVKTAVIYDVGQQINPTRNGKDCTGSRHKRNPAMDKNFLYFV